MPEGSEIPEVSASEQANQKIPEKSAMIEIIHANASNPTAALEELSRVPLKEDLEDSGQSKNQNLEQPVQDAASPGEDEVSEENSVNEAVISLDDITGFRIQYGLPRESELTSFQPVDEAEVSDFIDKLTAGRYEELIKGEEIWRKRNSKQPEYKANPILKATISRVLKMRGVREPEKFFEVMEKEGVSIRKSLMSGKYAEAFRQLTPQELQTGMQRTEASGNFFHLSNLLHGDSIQTLKALAAIPEDVFTSTLQDLESYTFVRTSESAVSALVDIMQNGGLTQDQRQKLDAMQKIALLTNGQVLIKDVEGNVTDRVRGIGIQFIMNDNSTPAELEDVIDLIGYSAYQAIKEGSEWRDYDAASEAKALLKAAGSVDFKKVKEITKSGIDRGTMRKLFTGYNLPSIEKSAELVDDFYDFIQQPENISWAELLEKVNQKRTGVERVITGLDVRKIGYYKEALDRFDSLQKIIQLIPRSSSYNYHGDNNTYFIKINSYSDAGGYVPQIDAHSFATSLFLASREMKELSPFGQETLLVTEAAHLLENRTSWNTSSEYHFNQAEPLLLYLSQNKARAGELFNDKYEPTDLFVKEIMGDSDIPMRSKTLFVEKHLESIDPSYVISNIKSLDVDTIISYAGKLSNDVFSRQDIDPKGMIHLKLIRDASTPELKRAIAEYKGEIEDLYKDGIPTSKYAEMAVVNGAYTLEQFGSSIFLDSLSPEDKIFWEQCIKVPQNFLRRILERKPSMDLTTDEGIRKLDTLISLLPIIAESPSQEIKRIGVELVDVLWQSPNPTASLQEITGIFERNNLPLVGKIYRVFETIYDRPDSNGSTILENDLSNKENLSPVLKAADTRVRREIIYRDLLSVNINSGNPQLRDYLEVIRDGENVVTRLENDGIDALTDREKVQLDHFLNKMDMLYSSSLFGRTIENRKKARHIDSSAITSAMNPAERIQALKRNFRVRADQKLSDRLSEMFLKPTGLDSIEGVLAEMDRAKGAADGRNREFAQRNQGKIVVKAGDRFKGVDSYNLEKILERGVVAREYLGASADSDGTPYDTDTSLILEQDLSEGLKSAMASSLSISYGDLLLVVRDRGQFGNGSNQYESFASGAAAERHYGIRTGFPSSEIDAIIAGNFDSRKMDDLFISIAQHGQYIPVAGRDGSIILTPEKYDEYRKTFDGVSEYSSSPVVVSRVGTDEVNYTFPESPQVVASTRVALDQLKTDITADREKVVRLSNNVRQKVSGALSAIGVNLRDEFDTSIYGAEFVDTGSTARGSNTPGDYDFDLSLQLDPNDFKRLNEVSNVVKEALKLQEDKSHAEQDYVQVRASGSEIIEGETLDIDIGIGKRVDDGIFASSDAVAQKLDSIRESLGDEAYYDVLANIVLTKKVLKAGHAYKKLEDGGIGGIGVENWILLNNGNMLDAFQSFWDAAHEGGTVLPFEEFSQKYKIFDAGVNIKYNNHDNFARILKPEGYSAMLTTIGGYLGYS